MPRLGNSTSSRVHGKQNWVPGWWLKRHNAVSIHPPPSSSALSSNRTQQHTLPGKITLLKGHASVPYSPGNWLSSKKSYTNTIIASTNRTVMIRTEIKYPNVSIRLEDISALD